jgi:DNA-binding Lrp family transcriptional regulator
MTGEPKKKKLIIRSDKKKNQAKIVKEVLKNPTSSQREIARKLNVSNSTVSEHMQEIEQNNTLAKDPRIRAISDDDLLIVKLVQKETIVRLETPEELKKINALDLNRIWDISIKRHSLIIGKATDSLWWLNVVSEADLLE